MSLLAALPLAALGVALVPQETPSRSTGTPSQGQLEHGVSFPVSGDGFVTYSYLGWSIGRQYVHSAVRDAVMAAFAARSRAESGRTFVLGETGKREGGPFPPHKTHQNGMSVDIFMPIDHPDGSPAVMSCWPWNKFGYNLEFDEKGRMGVVRINFESLAAYLLELERQARQYGLRVSKVIVAPEYVPQLLGTPSGRQFDRLERTLVRTPVWVRHDEHFHVDFDLLGSSALSRDPPEAGHAHTASNEELELTKPAVFSICAGFAAQLRCSTHRSGGEQRRDRHD